MARIQPVRGLPESKQVFTTDNFAGGINLAFSDDNISDAELKQIINYSLDERGSLTSRKGFGEFPVFKEIFGETDTSAIFSFTQTGEVYNKPIILLSKVFQNDNSFFQNAISSSSLEDFKKVQTSGSRLKVFVLYYVVTEGNGWVPTYNYRFAIIDISMTGVNINPVNITTSTLTPKQSYKIETNISNIEYADKLYFIIDSKLYNFDYNTLTVTSSDAYKPNALEIRKVGFNVLATNPLSWIDTQGITTKSIQGMFITMFSTDSNYDNKVPLMYIPNSAAFYLNIMYTGTIAGFDIAFKDFDTGSTMNATKTLISNSGGIARYKIIFDVSPYGEVEIKINETGQTLYSYDYYTAANPSSTLKPITTLSLKDFKFTQIYSRLVYYSGNIIWFSDIDRFDYIPNYNYITLNIDNDDEITKIMFFRNVYIIFTKKQIFKMSGAFGAADFGLSLVNDTIGCISGSTAIMVETEIFFLSYRGLFALRAEVYREGLENVRRLDAKVEKMISISEDCFATYIDNNYTLYANNSNKTWRQYNTYSLLHKGAPGANLGYYSYSTYSALVAAIDAHMAGTAVFNTEMPNPSGYIFIIPNVPYDDVYYWEANYVDDTYTLTKIMPEAKKVNILNINYDMPDAIQYRVDLRAFTFINYKAFPQHIFAYEGDLFTVYKSISGIKENYDFDKSYGIFTKFVETSGLNLGYALHTKKIKEIILKVSGGEVLNPIYVTGYADGLIQFDTNYYVVSIDENTGEVVYLEENDPSFTIPPVGLLGQFIIGLNRLGQQNYYLGKIKKKLVGKNISLKITSDVDTSVGIQSIGYTFKLGKIKQ